ncbi:hypothetical protein BOTBODRAFT_452131 [Botryobasidium botryosum FD-172 SS1]|uniref:Uncharacterized protein n=1 Tax=Botryobasidium botryosum (strain FD-172 SS1) TaxID=930990 RepID=A0A067MI23_BOTB1|nr:hypothetical protein BOTBODRAFT_452131 [Botryobasidium botryosum FD-172 SS1]
MRFGAILSVLSLGLLAIAAPTPSLQDVAVARSAPVDLVVRDVVSPALSFDKGVGDVVAARAAAADDFMAQLNSINNDLKAKASQLDVVADVNAWIALVAAIEVHIGVLVNLFTAAIAAKVNLDARIAIVVQIWIGLFTHIGAAWTPLAAPIYSAINASPAASALVSLGINIVVSLGIVVGVKA